MPQLLNYSKLTYVLRPSLVNECQQETRDVQLALPAMTCEAVQKTKRRADFCHSKIRSSLREMAGVRRDSCFALCTDVQPTHIHNFALGEQVFCCFGVLLSFRPCAASCRPFPGFSSSDISIYIGMSIAFDSLPQGKVMYLLRPMVIVLRFLLADVLSVICSFLDCKDVVKLRLVNTLLAASLRDVRVFGRSR